MLKLAHVALRNINVLSLQYFAHGGTVVSERVVRKRRVSDDIISNCNRFFPHVKRGYGVGRTVCKQIIKIRDTLFNRVRQCLAVIILAEPVKRALYIRFRKFLRQICLHDLVINVLVMHRIRKFSPQLSVFRVNIFVFRLQPAHRFKQCFFKFSEQISVCLGIFKIFVYLGPRFGRQSISVFLRILAGSVIRFFVCVIGVRILVGSVVRFFVCVIVVRIFAVGFFACAIGCALFGKLRAVSFNCVLRDAEDLLQLRCL